MKSVKTKGKSIKTSDIPLTTLPVIEVQITFTVEGWLWDTEIEFEYYMNCTEDLIYNDWNTIIRTLKSNHTKDFRWTAIEFPQIIQPEDVTQELLDCLTDEYYEEVKYSKVRQLAKAVGHGSDVLPPSGPSGGFNLPRGTKTAIGAYVGYKVGKKIGGSGFFN